MAIVQVSRITHRKGLQENLPQLAGAEFGWTIDERRLFIGNGTLEDGAPTIGNTEILTENSNIIQLLNTYTYEGRAALYIAQTGPSPGDDVMRSIQDKFDEVASVADFGAVGDGVVDDTQSINRALKEVFTGGTNVKVRRALFFPAGTYNVSSEIKIPPYAKLYGDGVNSSIVRMVDHSEWFAEDPARTLPPRSTAVTSDGVHQSGVLMGSTGATMPSYIEVASMTFENAIDGNVFLIDRGFDISFQNVGFFGNKEGQTLPPGSGIDTGGLPSFPGPGATTNTESYGLGIVSDGSVKSKNVRLDQCLFYGTTHGIAIDNDVRGISATATRFDMLYNGVSLYTGAISSVPLSNVTVGPSAVIISSSIFDHIYNIGFYAGYDNQYKIGATRNISANNVYLDVGNNLQGSTLPQTHVISFNSPNNVSTGDMFERSDSDALNNQHERVHFGNNSNISIENGYVIRAGALSTEAGQHNTLADNTLTQTQTGIVFDNTHHRAVSVQYNVVRGSNVRVGKLNIMQIVTGTVVNAYLDDQYTSTGDVGVTFYAQNSTTPGEEGLTFIYYTLTENLTSGLPDPIDAVLSYNLEYFRDPTLDTLIP